MIPCRFWQIAITVSVFVRVGLCDEQDVTGPPETEPIQVSADFSHDGGDSQDTRVYVLRGNCRVRHGVTTLSSQKGVLWHVRQADRDRVTVYLEGDVTLEQPDRTLSQPTLFLTLTTLGGVEFDIRHRLSGAVPSDDPLLRRAAEQKEATQRSELQPTQLVVSNDPEPGWDIRSVPLQAPAGDYRRIRISPRSVIPFNVYSEQSTDTTPPEQITVLTGGINLLIDGVTEFGTIDLSADHMVIWTRSSDAEQIQAGVETVQMRDTPFQVYLEGNIEIRQGLNLLRAERAFYDAREDRALLIDAELKAYLAILQGNLRLRAQKLRQLSQNSFHAQQAWVSTSAYGKPGYRLQANDIFLENRHVSSWLGSGRESFDPVTGLPAGDEVSWVTSLNNSFLVDDLPLMYTPFLSGPAEDPHIPLRRASLENDDIFGVQVETVWNAFKLFGLDAPRGVEWDLSADYRSERGPGLGTGGEYRGTSLLGLPGSYRGEGLVYYQYDDGEDNLGLSRRTLDPEDPHRGRALIRHRHNLPANTTLLGEVGFLSDRNYLEQYYEHEFDRSKDNETLLYLKQQIDNWNWTGLIRPQVNDFENTTTWLPRGDLYVLSEPLFGGLLTWTAHTSAGYAQLRSAAAPPNTTADPFAPLPYFADSDGAVMMSRHELDLPFQIGAVHLVPYLMGEAAYWSDGLTQSDVDRYVGTAGVRGSLMLWRVYPYVCSRILNLSGLAHKMVFDADYAWTDSSRGLGDIAQYNEFDDNSQERLRERMFGTPWIYPSAGAAIYDPRFYAVRSGAGRSVTVPYHELIDDQQVLRVGWRHRLQTKVGPPERLRIKDWMSLDLEASYFPDPNRDNFGEDLGLLGARYNWQLGDRTSILANAYYDLFDDGHELWDVGLQSDRPTRGAYYVGLRQVRAGDIESQIVTASVSYTMSPKWTATVATAYDLGESRNAGQSLMITRVGLDFLVHIGASFDESKGNAGIGISVEPRIGNRGLFGRSFDPAHNVW